MKLHHTINNQYSKVIRASNRYSNRVFYEIYRHEHEGELPYKTRGFLMLCVLYHDDPLPTVS